MPPASASAVTQLGLGGWPGQRYGSFAGKSTVAAILGDEVTTRAAVFARTVTGRAALFGRTRSGKAGVFARTVTGDDTER